MKIRENIEPIEGIKIIIKWSLFLNITLCILLIIVSTVLVKMIPLKKYIPFLLEVTDKSEYINVIKPLDRTNNSYKLLIDKYARQYVSMRESIDLISDEKRWGDLSIFNDNLAMSKFKDLMLSNKPESPYSKYIENKIIRIIKIIDSNDISHGSKKLHRVEWDAIDQDKDTSNLIQKDRYISIIEYALKEKTMRDHDKYSNPIGFTVKKYRVTKNV